MRDPQRIPQLIRRLQAVWAFNPDLRLGQLLINVFRDDFYYLEDNALIAELEKFYAFSYYKKMEKDATKLAQGKKSSRAR